MDYGDAGGGVACLVLGAAFALGVPTPLGYEPRNAPLLGAMTISAKAPWNSRGDKLMDDDVITADLGSNYGYAVSRGIVTSGEIRGDIVRLQGRAQEVTGDIFTFYIFSGGDFNLWRSGQTFRPYLRATEVSVRAFDLNLTKDQASQALYFVVEKSSVLQPVVTVRTVATATWVEAVPSYVPGFESVFTPALVNPAEEPRLTGRASSPAGQRFDLYVFDPEGFRSLGGGSRTPPLLEALNVTAVEFSLNLTGDLGNPRQFYFAVENPDAVDSTTNVSVSAWLGYMERPSLQTSVLGAILCSLLAFFGGVLLTIGWISHLFLQRSPQRDLPIPPPPESAGATRPPARPYRPRPSPGASSGLPPSPPTLRVRSVQPSGWSGLCGRCGASLAPGVVYCGACGARVA